MNSQEMMHTNCGPNNHFENIAPLGEAPNWVIVSGGLESHTLNDNPKLFGYDQKEFLAKQYKKGHTK